MQENSFKQKNVGFRKATSLLKLSSITECLIILQCNTWETFCMLFPTTYSVIISQLEFRLLMEQWKLGQVFACTFVVLAECRNIENTYLCYLALWPKLMLPIPSISFFFFPEVGKLIYIFLWKFIHRCYCQGRIV